MNKKFNERAFNIAIFDENSKLWRKPLDINKLSPRFKESVTKMPLTPDYALMLENIICISYFKLLHRINKGSYVPLYEILDLLGIPVKDNQVLAGWDTDNYDPLVPIFEYEYDEENDRYILNFVTCDETMLLKRYERSKTK